MITEKMIVDEVRKVIRENPDYVYKRDRCSYLKCNEACVFGVVLSNLGLSQDDLKKCEKLMTLEIVILVLVFHLF